MCIPFFSTYYTTQNIMGMEIALNLQILWVSKSYNNLTIVPLLKEEDSESKYK